MADNITDLASEAGVSPDQVQKGLGAILGFLKDKLPADSFSQVSDAVPDSDRMMAAAAQTGEESSGGLFGAVKEMVGKLFGGGGGELVSRLTQLGFSADQMKAFLPKVLAFLKGKLPADVVNKIADLIPAEKESADVGGQ
jgi:hypothetical protein